MATASQYGDNNPFAKIDPSSINIQPGNNVCINVSIDSGEKPVIGIEIFLHYPSPEFTFNSKTSGHLLGTSEQVIDITSHNHSEGFVRIAIARRAGNAAVPIKGVLYTLCFTGPNTTGAYTLNLDEAIFMEDVGKAIQNIDVSNGIVEVGDILPLSVSCSGPQTGFIYTPLHFFGNVTGGTPPYLYHWDFDDGSISNNQNPIHTFTQARTYGITLTVTDTLSVVRECVLAVTLATPGNLLPHVTILSPASNDVLTNTLLITGTANDDDGGVQMVQIRLDDGSWITVNGTVNWSYTWVTTYQDNGNHTITARSYDGIDYSHPVSLHFIINNEEKNNDGTPGFILGTLAAGLLFGAYIKKRYESSNH